MKGREESAGAWREGEVKSVAGVGKSGVLERWLCGAGKEDFEGRKSLWKGRR